MATWVPLDSTETSFTTGGLEIVREKLAPFICLLVPDCNRFGIFLRRLTLPAGIGVAYALERG